MSKNFFTDERTEIISGRAAFLVMSLMQVALAGSMVVRRYLLHQQSDPLPEVFWILLLSLASYWGFRIYLSGVLAPMSIRRSVILYLMIESVMVGVSYFIHGLPPQERWAVEILPMLITPAVFIGLYNLVAILGKKRIEKQISD